MCVWRIANGYNAVIVSDHNSINGGLAAQEVAQEKYSDKITVIPAMELTYVSLGSSCLQHDKKERMWHTDDLP